MIHSKEDIFTANAVVLRPYVCELIKNENQSYVNNQKRDEVGIVQATYFDNYRFTNDWTEAHEAVKAFIAYYGGNRYAHEAIHHYAALMLDKYLLGQPDSKEVVDAIGFYLELMTDYQSYETEIIALALHRLKSEWPKERLRKTALFAEEMRKQYKKSPKWKSNDELEAIHQRSIPLLKEIIKN